MWASESDPLAWQHFHVWRSVELQLEDVTRQQLSLEDVQLHVGSSEGDNLVEGVDDSREDKVDPEEGGGSDSLETMKNTEEVEKNIQLMNLPEECIGFCSNFWMSKYEYGAHSDPQNDNSCSWKCTRVWNEIVFNGLC